MAALLFNTLSLLRQVLRSTHLTLTKALCQGFPQKWHTTLSRADIGGRPVFIVGDIHGCYDELLDLLTAATDVSGGVNPYLVCVGDMLNKGPKSLDVLLFLKDKMKQNMARAVKGNHEEAILRQYKLVCLDKNYELPERYKYLNDFSHDDFAFIDALPYSVSIPHLNALIVHAGLVPGVPLNEQRSEDLCHMRNLVTKVTLPWGKLTFGIKKPTEGVAWATAWQGPQHVYFGHDCRRGLQEMPLATGLDTGCVYGDRLTGVLLFDNSNGLTLSPTEPDARLLSVPAKCQHYLGKPGKDERKRESVADVGK